MLPICPVLMPAIEAEPCSFAELDAGVCFDPAVTSGGLGTPFLNIECGTTKAAALSSRYTECGATTSTENDAW